MPLKEPKIALIIPAYNEELTIASAIYSAVARNFIPTDIVVVDDGSTDRTYEIADEIGCKVIRTDRAGKAGAIKQALHNFQLLTHYTHIGILDADSTLMVGFRKEMVNAIKENPDAALFCGSPISRKNNWLTAYRAVEYAICLSIYRQAQNALGVINVAPGCASLYNTKDLADLDLSGDTLVEDMDLTIQLQRKRKQIVFVSKAKVNTQDPSTLADYIGQLKRWYRGGWQVVRKHRLGRRFRPIDFEIGLLMGESLIFSLMVMLMPLLLWRYPKYVLIGFAIDQGLFFLSTCWAATLLRRGDVIKYFPLYTVPRMVNAGIFLWSFIVERRPRRLTPASWFSPKRY